MSRTLRRSSSAHAPRPFSSRPAPPTRSPRHLRRVTRAAARMHQRSLGPRSSDVAGSRPRERAQRGHPATRVTDRVGRPDPLREGMAMSKSVASFDLRLGLRPAEAQLGVTDLDIGRHLRLPCRASAYVYPLADNGSRHPSPPSDELTGFASGRETGSLRGYRRRISKSPSPVAVSVSRKPVRYAKPTADFEIAGAKAELPTRDAHMRPARARASGVRRVRSSRPGRSRRRRSWGARRRTRRRSTSP